MGGGAGGGGGAVDGGRDGGDGGATDAGIDAGTCADRVVELTFAVLADGGRGATVTADTAARTDDSAGTCVFGGGGGREVPFHFVVTTRQLLTARSIPVDGGDPTLYLKAGSCSAAADIACEDRGARGAIELLDRVLLDAGDYYLYADNYDRFGNGLQTLEVSLSELPGPPANDSCAAPLALTFINDVANATGDTGAADNSNQLADGGVTPGPRCSPSAGAQGRDVVFSFIVPPGPSKNAIIDVVATSAGFSPVAYVMAPGECSGETSPDGGTGELTCGPVAPGEPITLSGLNPGTYFLWVDGRNSTTGSFVLTVTLSNAAVAGDNDLCTRAIAVLDGATSQTVAGVTRNNTDNSNSVCTLGPGKDVYYRFSTQTALRFTALATPAPDSGYRPVLYLLPIANCMANGAVTGLSLQGCSAAGSPDDAVALEVSALDAGTWLLVVDGNANTSGPFSLDVSVGALTGVAINDVCSTALPLTFAPQRWGQVALASGSTRGANNDHTSLSCFSAGPDMAFAFTTPSDGGLDGGVNVKASVWSNNVVEANLSLYVERDCDGGLVACRDPGFGPAAVNAWGRPSSTPYVVWVDQLSDAGGPFTLQVEIATMPPPNDSCAGAIDMPLDTTVAGSTLGALNHFIGTWPDAGFYQGAVACGDQLPGADVVYRFTSTTRGAYRVRVSPDRTYDPGLAVTRSCAMNACIDTVDVGLSGDDEVIVVNAPEMSTFYVFVEGYSDNPSQGTARGSYGVSVESPAGPGTLYLRSCAEVLADGGSVGDGVYAIDPQQDGVPEQAFCDMTTGGGGWTVLVNNHNGDVEPSGCVPRIATDPDYACGTITAAGDFSVYAAGLSFIEMVLASRDGGLGTTSGAYQAMRWSSPQQLPFTQVWTLAAPQSVNGAIPGWVGLPLECVGPVVDAGSVDAGPTWMPIPGNVLSRGGAYPAGMTMTVLGEASDAGGCAGLMRRMSFSDTGAASSTSSLIGLDDFSDGCGCSDLWSPQAYRGSGAYLMVR